MRRVRWTVCAGLAVGIALLAFTLSRSPLGAVRASTSVPESLGHTEQRNEACQSNEVLPRDTSAVRLGIGAWIGPRVDAEFLSSGRVIARGERGTGWTGDVVTVPVRPLAVTRTGVTLCYGSFLRGDETSYVIGERTAPAVAARDRAGIFPGRFLVEDLQPERSSWWSLVPQVARRIGMSHARSGTSSVLLIIVLMVGAAAATTGLALRELA